MTRSRKVWNGLLLLLLGSTGLWAQSKQLRRADQLFKAKQYAEAAAIYEDQASEGATMGTKNRLAFCYRMNNRTEAAERLYADLVDHPKAKDEALRYYGEVLMSNGKYEQARTWLGRYLDLEPDDEAARLLYEACALVGEIEPQFPGATVREWVHNSPADDGTPVRYGDALVFSSDRDPGGLKVMKQKSGWTGRDFLRLYVSAAQGDSSWAAPKELSDKLNELNRHTGNPSFTAAGDELFFTQNSLQPDRRGNYNMQLYRAESGGGQRWKNQQLLDFNTPNYHFMHPAVSPDGQMLVFVSDKPGGQGGTDLWLSERRRDGSWGRSQNLGHVLNTSAHEAYPYLSADGKLYFCSKGHVGFGGFDLFVSTRDADGQWTAPVNLGRPVNSPHDDISLSLDPAGRSGWFASSRSGGDDDIFRLVWE